MAAESIVVKGVKKRYGDFWAVKGIDFRVHPGEIVGFLGPNGAGKTTTMKILTSFMAATEGEVKVAGFDVRRDPHDVRRNVGYLPENVPLYDEMIVYDYLQFIAALREVDKKDRDRRIATVAERTGITHMLGRTIYELSKGYRQRVGLAQAIIHEPAVIILDEPTTGLDPNQIIEIRDVIKTIGEEKTIIFSTHIMQEVTAVCDRIIIINDGELVADGSLAELEERVAETQPGLLLTYKDQKPEPLRKALEGLEPVEVVTAVTNRPGEIAFRIEGHDDTALRRALIEAEANDPHGLLSLRQAEPTLEEIFRLHTTPEHEHEHENENQDAHENEDEDQNENENEDEDQNENEHQNEQEKEPAL